MECCTIERVGRIEEAEAGVLSWRNLIALLAILSLVTTLASRTFATGGTAASVHSYPSQIKIQHRDKDAHRWSVPAPAFVLLESSGAFTRITPQEEPFASLRVDNPCFNRPPPSS